MGFASRLAPPPLPVTLAAAAVCYAVSCGFTAVGALALVGIVALVVAAGRLLATLHVAHARRWAALVALLPSVILDTASGRCDALYAAPAMLALEAAVARRHGRMLLWYGVAVAATAQAAALAPFVVALLIQRRVPVRDWWAAPAAFAALSAALWATGALPAMPRYWGSAPNLWSMAQAILPQTAISLLGLALAAAVGATGAYVAHFSVRMPAGVRVLPVALLAVLLVAGLLPDMPAHAFFLADIAAFVWAIAVAERRAWGVALLIQAGSTLAAMAHGLDAPALVVPGFACMAAATWRVAAPLLRPAANDNPIMARAA